MERSNIFYFLTSILFLFCGTGLIQGCTNENNLVANETLSGQKDYIYVAEKETFTDKNFISAVCSGNGIIYLSTHQEESGENKIYRIDPVEKETVSVFLPLENEGRSQIEQMTADSRGNLIFLEKNETEVEGEIQTFYYIKTYALDREDLVSRVDISSVLDENTPTFVSGFATDNLQRFYLAEGKRILVLNSTGELLFEVNPNIKWFLGLEINKEGSPIFLAASADETGLLLGVIDPEKKQIEKTLSGIKGGNINAGVAVGSESEWYLNCNGIVSAVDIQTGTLQEEFFWSDSNISDEEVRFLVPLSDGRFVAVLTRQKSEEYDTQIAYLSKTLRSEADTRVVLTLATLESSHMLLDVVNYYNRVNTEYRIDIKSYIHAGASKEDYEQAELQMKLDLLSGNGPDILDTWGMDMRQLSAQGVIEDLSPYLKADEDLKDVKFFRSVLKANSEREKLLCLPPYFTALTMYGRQSEVGEKTGLAMEEVFNLVQSYQGEGRVSSRNQSSLVKVMLLQNLSRFVNWQTGICTMDSEEFVELLEFAKRYGMTQEAEREMIRELEQGESYEVAMFEIDSLENGLAYKSMEANYGEPITVIGFPVASGSGSNGVILENVNAFFMCTSSEKKEGVWSFLRTLLMPDYYEELLENNPENMFFPSRKDIYEQAFEKWMETEEITDENGQEYIVSKYEFGDYLGNTYRDPLTLENKKVITGLLEDASMGMTFNDAIIRIVEEEAESFFQGQKSAEETAGIIQSRVQVYVNENQ